MNRQKLTATLGLAGLLLSVPVLAAVYMEKDADGNTVFTDRPHSKKARPIELSPTSTYSPPASTSTTTNTPYAGNDKQTLHYEFLSIISPTDDSPVRANDGSLEVSIDLSPALQTGHHFVLLIDGSPVGEGMGPNFSLQNIDRGTHTLQVQVVDDSGNEIISSNNVTFHMLRV